MKNDLPKGTVTFQSLEQGAKVKPKTIINLQVSQGPDEQDPNETDPNDPDDPNATDPDPGTPTDPNGAGDPEYAAACGAAGRKAGKDH